METVQQVNLKDVTKGKMGIDDAEWPRRATQHPLKSYLCSFIWPDDLFRLKTIVPLIFFSVNHLVNKMMENSEEMLITIWESSK